MPLGSPQDEIGILDERDGQWTLRREGGGTWRLELALRHSLRARRLAGRRVRILGIREEYDLLSVAWLDATED